MKKLLRVFAALAVAVGLSGCQAGQTDIAVSETTQESVELPYGYEDATVVDDETMDFLRSLLCIKGEPITFPCTYNELKNILDKHNITIKPSGCWSDDNPDNRDVCFVDLYDGDTYFMALTGTCVSEDDLESYIFDGTGVGEVAKNYISINNQEPMFIGDICENIILGTPLKNVGINEDSVAVIQAKNNLFFCEVRYYANSSTKTLESFTIVVHNMGGNNNE